jgi:hypothetical protein
VLGGDVLVAEGRGLLAGPLQQPAQLGRGHGLLLGTVDLGDPLQGLGGPDLEHARVGPGPAHDRVHDPVGVGQQGDQEVLGLDPLVVAGARLALGGGQRLGGPVGEAVDVHRWFRF